MKIEPSMFNIPCSFGLGWCITHAVMYNDIYYGAAAIFFGACVTFIFVSIFYKYRKLKEDWDKFTRQRTD